jgi:hypothetical protein
MLLLGVRDSGWMHQQQQSKSYANIRVQHKLAAESEKNPHDVIWQHLAYISDG